MNPIGRMIDRQFVDASPHAVPARARAFIGALHRQVPSSQGVSPLPAWLWIAAAFASVLLGLVLRCTQYRLDRSLFLDEVFVATNVVDRSFAELLQPLEYDQRAPAGFLFAVKIAALLLGPSDLALRLFPLMAGLVSAMAFFCLARRWLSGPAMALATLLFSLAPPLVFLASDLKQYSTDAAATALILLAVGPLLPAVGAGGKEDDRPGSHWRWSATLAAALSGAAALWFSFPAVFVLAAAACALLLHQLRQRGRELVKLLAILLAWSASFALLYWLQLRHFAAEPSWKQLWNSEFMPFPIGSLGDWEWLMHRSHHLATCPLGIAGDFGALGLLACLAGAADFGRRPSWRLVLLAGPIALLFAASAARFYPVGGRVIMFLAPIIALLTARGVDVLWTSLAPGRGWLVTAMLALMLYNPAACMARHLIKGTPYRNSTFPEYNFEETKPLLAYLRDHWQPGDVVYLYSDARTAFRYYAPRFGLADVAVVEGIQSALVNPSWTEVEADVGRLRGRPRVWFFCTHVWKGNGVDDRRLWLYFLDRLGERRDAFELPIGYDAALYLYDLAAKPALRAD